MGVMTRMRTAMPVVVIGAAVLFVLLIVLEWGMDITGMNRNRVAATEKIGSVNGRDISYKEFETELTQQLDLQKAQRPDMPEEMEGQIREGVWDRFVSDALTNALLAKLGVEVSDEEVRDILIENPPAYLRRQFTDSLGNFDLASYQNVISQIANYQGGTGQGTDQERKMDTMYNALLKIEENVHQTRMQEKFQSVMGAGVLVSDADVREKFYNDNAKADVSYAFFDMNMIPDDAVGTSDDEIKAYFDKHPEEFQQQETRKVKYAFIYLMPSVSDSLSVQKKMTQLVDSLHATQDTAHQAAIFNQFYTRYNEQETQNDAFVGIKEMGPNKAYGVLSAPVGGYSNVVPDQDGYHVFHIVEARPGATEYVHFQQIVLGFGANKDSAREQAMKIVEPLRTDKKATIEMGAQLFSIDAASRARGGDVGFVAKGTLPKTLDDAVFSAPIGAIVGPIETEMGFVIFKVKDRGNNEVRLKDLKMTVHISSQSRQASEHQGQELHDRVVKGEKIDTVAAQLKVRVYESQPLTRNVPLLGSLEFTSWIFKSNVGDISEPKRLRGNTVVMQVSEIRNKGLKPFDEVKGVIKQKLIMGKKLDNLVSRAADAKELLHGDSLEKIRQYAPNAQVAYAAGVSPRGAATGIGNDVAFNAAVFQLENVDQVSAPVRGQRGVYLLQLRKKMLPNDSMFVLQRDIIRNSLQQSRRSTFLQGWIEKQKETAKIEDHRDKFFRN